MRKHTRLALRRGLPLGVAAGLMSGLFGVGGGTVLVPGFVLLLGLSQHAAHATSLAAILLTATAGMIPFALDGAVAVVPGLAIAAGALVGAYSGAGVMHRLSERRLRQAFAALLLIVAARMLLAPAMAGGPLDLTPAHYAGLALLGVAAGWLSALLGVGGGVIMVPAMVLLFGFSQHAAEGTSLLVIIPTALVGSIRHSRRGYTDWRLGGLIGASGVLGALAGASVALMLTGVALQQLFSLFLAVIATRLLLTPEAPDPA
ncbi:MAG TPA: sulfite exporter TauE/SafE family protein [Egibacteraceae bacterium]|nr:sulfite exporter TauE/SafE family protein [Egibacteraceae bacterium]